MSDEVLRLRAEVERLTAALEAAREQVRAACKTFAAEHTARIRAEARAATERDIATAIEHNAQCFDGTKGQWRGVVTDTKGRARSLGVHHRDDSRRGGPCV